MKNTTYYNAGAGSGKTHNLTSLLTKLIANEEAKPNEVILTTFTKKAANEFREKAKTMLYEKGLIDKAAELDNAIIGTIHSVCQQMINKYWYHLGLVPNMGVMDENDVQFYMSQSLADLPTINELKQLHSFAHEFEVPIKDGNFSSYGIDEDFWRNHLLRIIELATNYEITDFSGSIDTSIRFIKQFRKSSCNPNITDEELNTILSEAHAHVENNKRISKKQKYYEKFEKISNGRNNKTIAWYKQLKKDIETKYGTACETIVERLENLWYTDKVFQLQKEYIELIFKLADRWQEQYSQYKQEKNILDYNDMEKYMLRLMNNNDARNEIANSYKYLFVDEFQDSSPMQVKIFEALSNLVSHSYWVGDSKQAIYAFRGSDTDLTTAVVEHIRAGKNNNCEVKLLGTSYRSLPDIVEFTNDIFSKTFKGILNEKEITLNHARENTKNIQCLQYIDVDKEIGIPHYVAQLINDGAKPNEIAVIARTNSELNDIATPLANAGIPVNIDNLLVTDSKSYQLLTSLLHIVASKTDTLARAQVAILSNENISTKEIIETKLEFDSLPKSNKRFFDDEILISRLLLLTEKLQQLSISSMVEQIVVELNLFDWAKRIETNSEYGQSCLKKIISVAQTYEENCVRLNIPTTIHGFIAYMENTSPTAFGNPNGVQVITYHGSKGLQWKYVILTSLNNNITEENKIISREIYGIHINKEEKPSIYNLYPTTNIRLTPWIYGRDKKVPDSIVNEIDPNTINETINRVLAEANRLLYVGVTRASDVLILSIENGDSSNKDPLNWFKDIGGTNQDTLPETNPCKALATKREFKQYCIKEDISLEPKTETKVEILTSDIANRTPKGPRYISPSSVKGILNIKETKNFNYRIPLSNNNVEMNIVGNCIHNIFACIDEYNDKERNEMIDRIISQYHLKETLINKDSITTAWYNLRQYLAERFGQASNIYHERPFRMEQNGQTIVGSMDLVWQTKQGNIVIDFKTNPMGYKELTDKDSLHYAGRYGGQLNTYRKAIITGGETVIATIVYYPVAGLVIELE